VGTDEPPAFTLEAMMIALDEDEVRQWLDDWRRAPRQLRTLMESDIAVAAIARDRRDRSRRHEFRLFLDIVDSGDT
jgi:hypothetical protein